MGVRKAQTCSCSAARQSEITLTSMPAHAGLCRALMKNCSLIYPGDGGASALAPLYDVLSTVRCIPGGNMAWSLGRERSCKALPALRWSAFANRARLAQTVVFKAVVETVAWVNGWW